MLSATRGRHIYFRTALKTTDQNSNKYISLKNNTLHMIICLGRSCQRIRFWLVPKVIVPMCPLPYQISKQNGVHVYFVLNMSSFAQHIVDKILANRANIFLVGILKKKNSNEKTLLNEIVTRILQKKNRRTFPWHTKQRHPNLAKSAHLAICGVVFTELIISITLRMKWSVFGVPLFDTMWIEGIFLREDWWWFDYFMMTCI